MKDCTLKNLGEYINKIYKSHEYDDCVFRGQHSANFVLSSCLKRTYRERSADVELRLLENFKKYALTTEFYRDRSIWENMVIAQHHGVPTRLLDFTFSPLVAMHFALVDNKPDEDAAVWMINIDGLHRKILPKRYINVLDEKKSYVFTLDMLDQLHITIDQYNKDMNGKGLVFFEPPYIDERIRNQNSVLAVLPDELDPLDDFIKGVAAVRRFIIPAKKVPKFRKQLDYFNITERTMFPGLEGTADYLKRRYEHSEQPLQ